MIGRIDNLIYKKLDEGYLKHKRISSNIAGIELDKKNNPRDFKAENSIDQASSLEFHMAELLKNASKYNTLTRAVSQRSRIYEAAVKGR
jgi:flagellar basal body rod protein FlgB